MKNPTEPTAWKYDRDIYWEKTESSYSAYPTVRHRRRYITHTLKKIGLDHSSSFFDFGCGEGNILQMVQETFGLSAARLGGCDLSEKAIELARQRLKKVGDQGADEPQDNDLLFAKSFPVMDRQFDVILCSEVIEHTPDYPKILKWMYDHLAEGGHVIVTTQSGKIHASDIYTGHTQHFKIKTLNAMMRQMGYSVTESRLWGWPFFTLQKYLTDANFEGVKKNYLEGNLDFRKRVVFGIASTLFYIHDWIPFGPQIYLVGHKSP